MSQSTENGALRDRLGKLIESGLTREQALVELGFCPNDMEPLPCLTCGAGL